MDTIKVIWKSYHKPEILDRGYWDQGLLEDLLKKNNYYHQYEFQDIAPNEGAVVIINGRTHIEDTDAINADLAKLRWVVLLITGDEEALFPIQNIRHPLIRTWVMLPRMNLHNDVSFKMPNGYRPTTHKTLKEIGQLPKLFDITFIGQVNHPRREQCVEAANALSGMYRCNIVTTERFGHEKIDYTTYLKIIAESRIVLCPSGIESPDNFRLYEALEAGCLPVVDAFATNNQDWGFWQYLFGHDLPFPVIPYWDELTSLLPQLLKEYPANANKAFAWWQLYKRNMYNKLIKDINEVSR